jgi:4-aminobutyrate aminotransferase
MIATLQHVGPKAEAIIQRDAAVLATSYAREYPLVVDHALGSEIWDVDGRRYIDFMAGVCVLNVGHRHPRVVEAVHDFYYPQAAQLAEELQAIAPMAGNARTYFGNSGTEAVEAAIKLAMYKTGRDKFIGFLGAFHGRTLGSLSFTASKSVQSGGYPTAVKVFHLPFPDPYRPLLASQPGKDLGDAIINYLEEELFRTKLAPEDVAGVLVEPIQGEGGYVIPSPGFFPRLRQVCDEHGILLIVDEVQSGIGRTGRWWAIEHEGVEPDIVCFAKGIASGLPLGGILARDSVMVWERGAHGSTFGGNPLAVAAASATLQVIEEEGLLGRAETTGAFILDALAELKQRHASIGDVRGRGLMIGVEFVKDRQTKKRARKVRNAVVARAFEKGLLLLPCGPSAIRITPPLNVDPDLVDEGLHLFAAALAEAEQATGF